MITPAQSRNIKKYLGSSAYKVIAEECARAGLKNNRGKNYSLKTVQYVLAGYQNLEIEKVIAKMVLKAKKQNANLKKAIR